MFTRATLVMLGAVAGYLIWLTVIAAITHL